MDTVEKIESQDNFNDILNDKVDIGNEPDKDERSSLALPDTYQINSGEALSRDKFYTIAAKESTKMLLLLGPVASGKTTIETSLYQLFQEKPVENYYFAGSRSLQGFEQRAYYTRIKSKGSLPDTPRTKVDEEPTFLHLRLWNRDNDATTNLIFWDISGEAFSENIGKVDSVKKEFSFAERADFVIGIIDGEKLCNKKTKNSVVSEIIQLLRTFLDSGVLGEGCVLQIVFSKYDLLIKEENYAEIIERAKNQINGYLEELSANIEYYCVAAMPSSAKDIQVGYGLSELLQRWCKKREYISWVPKKLTDFENLSEYDKLFFKYNGSSK
ncbi:hypothetical protein KE513_14105 [Oscillospiraceae bacterium Marseille-Q3528]|jgi:energy-coupling factor transporter ATP-binding protein EcfA2|nr:hypothetical protein [Oscillospiraceae bacterium Marseille-Q3528]